MQLITFTTLFATLVATSVGAPLASGVEEEACSTFGQYSCGSLTTIVQCGYAANGQLELLFIGNCPVDTHCGYIGTIPYCVAN